MFTAACAAGAVLGDADSRRAASFGVLALGFLGMDGRRGRLRISLCSSFPNAIAANGAGRVLRAAVARAEMNAPKQLNNLEDVRSLLFWSEVDQFSREPFAYFGVTAR